MEKIVMKVFGVDKEINIYQEEEIDKFDDNYLENTLDLSKEVGEIGNECE